MDCVYESNLFAVQQNILKPVMATHRQERLRADLHNLCSALHKFVRAIPPSKCLSCIKKIGVVGAKHRFAPTTSIVTKPKPIPQNTLSE
jgi:hypothetical protein